MTVRRQMLKTYDTTTTEGAFNGLREVMQEIALAGLYRGGSFDKAGFYCGTRLRIFYGLPRFSEDLDFSLLAGDPDFSLEPYCKVVRKEFTALGLDVEIISQEENNSNGDRFCFSETGKAESRGVTGSTLNGMSGREHR